MNTFKLITLAALLLIPVGCDSDAYRYAAENNLDKWARGDGLFPDRARL